MESLLKQTYLNWELIVTDDCSYDKSIEVLRRYESQDTRVRVFENDRNRHVSHAINNCLKHVRGKYICFMSCDDAFFPEKLSSDVAYMERHQDIGVLYGQLQQINERNVFQNYSYSPSHSFDQKTLLKEMYLEGNRCPSPGMFLKKSVVDKVGYFRSLLRMTQDYEYHVRVLFQVKPAFNDVPLTQYRRMSNNTNLSSTDDECTINSECNETFFILENYLKYIQKYDTLKNIFPEVIDFGSKDDRLIPYYLGRIAITSRHSYVQAFGIQTIFHFMLQRGNAEYLERVTGFLPKDLMNIMAQHHIYHSLKYPQQYSFIKKLRKKIYRSARFLYRKIV